MTWAGAAWAAATWAGGYPNAITPPGPPENVEVTANSNNTITSTWSTPSTGDPVEWYEIRVDGVAPSNIGDVLTYTTVGLAPATTYTFGVRACNNGGCSTWVSVGVTTPAPLLACPCGNPVGV